VEVGASRPFDGGRGGRRAASRLFDGEGLWPLGHRTRLMEGEWALSLCARRMRDAGVVRVVSLVCGMCLVTVVVQASDGLKEKQTVGWLSDDGLLASEPHGIYCLNTVSHVALPTEAPRR